MSDNIYVLQESSSEYETSSEDDEEERVNVVQQEMKFYEHTNYVNETLKNMTVTIVVKDFTDFTHWTVNFPEPIIVHKICDIYLDNIITHHVKIKHTVNNKGFLLSIDEFNIKNNVATSATETRTFKDKLFIPNDHSSTSATADLTHTHKSKKLNFVSTIQPCKINTLSGSITILDGTHIWHDTTTSKHQFTAEFIFQFRN